MRIQARSSAVFISLAAVSLLAANVSGQGIRPSPTGFGRVLFPGGESPGSSGSTTGFGRVLFPGTGAPVITRPGVNGNVSNGAKLPQVTHQNHSTPILIPYPVYYTGGFYNYDTPAANLLNYPDPPGYRTTSSSANPYPNQNGGYQEQAQSPSPVVIINQYFTPEATAPAVFSTAPQAERQSAPEVVYAPQPPVPDTPVFLIAMKDHTIFAANAYWIESGTLNYVTLQGSKNSASMELVDRELSQRLNRERNVEFGLPEK
jgi:hypothetical protein